MAIGIRHAAAEDLPRLLELYRLLDVGPEPVLGSEQARRVFDALTADPDHAIYVAESGEGVVGTFALIFIGGLAHGAAERAVTVRSSRASPAGALARRARECRRTSARRRAPSR